MPQLHRPTAILVAAVLVVGLTTSCSAVKEKLKEARQTQTVSASPQAASTSVMDVQVSGGEAKGEEPQVTFPKPLAVTATERTILEPGDGAKVKRGQRLTVDYLGMNATDGSVFDSSYARGRRSSFVLTDSGALIKGLVEGLDGVTVGSRVVIAVPPADGYGLQGVPASGIGPTDTLIFVVDVQDAGEVLKRAKGSAVKPKSGLPKVKLAKGGEPTITLPGGDAPASLVVQPLIKGKGGKVGANDSVTAHYKAVIWPGGRQYHSTWGKEPETFEIGNGRVLAGLASGLVGQTVGSQVLIVIPPDQGYGAVGKPDAGIRGTDTLVFVVDILEAT